MQFNITFPYTTLLFRIILKPTKLVGMFKDTMGNCKNLITMMIDADNFYVCMCACLHVHEWGWGRGWGRVVGELAAGSGGY